jgi:hypothetical protein
LSEAKDKIPLVVIANANRRTNTATLFIIISSNNYPELFIKNVDTLFNKSYIDHSHYSSSKSL